MGPIRKNKELCNARSDILNGEDEVALEKEDTRAWVQKTFYEKPKRGPGPNINYEKWKALDILNKT